MRPPPRRLLSVDEWDREQGADRPVQRHLLPPRVGSHVRSSRKILERGEARAYVTGPVGGLPPRRRAFVVADGKVRGSSPGFGETTSEDT